MGNEKSNTKAYMWGVMSMFYLSNSTILLLVERMGGLNACLQILVDFVMGPANVKG